MSEDASTRELELLARAVELAEQGRGRVSPNPLVGAVITRDGEVIGEGWHHRYGDAHAEVEAIASAGGPGATVGATMLVSLEPCCHEGKTPPCTDAIVEAGISRVLFASDDPSTKASGRGPGNLRDEGIEVVSVTGEIRSRAKAINQPFRKHAQTGRPWVLSKSAMSLDGKVASATGDSKWISGEQSRKLVHRWRAELDSVAVGIGTALSDDPQLTARDIEVERQPRRIVFDSAGRLSVDSKLVNEAAVSPLTVVVGRGADRGQLSAIEAHGAEVIVATGENEAARVVSALDQLGALGVTSLLLEGGPRLAGAFLDAGEIDELRVFIAPILIGARSARDPFEGAGSDSVAEAVQLPNVEVEQIERDILVTSRLREW
ncbi:MAG: bifunctional diaminohydroxyphosphoribosylaminopyrimidine deaminase/5-amino-6-(5-phosphoribosylamino)uracil reductase RibD [Solirubrobacterales bacterium]|nr:bifunctional diaminohydroxyphosphoribosylaminopyrimidine deaminase/5-amino-6-(5-phosphoribosylamino)uracil reductase RibD [Solirubrobacterales bacterium]